jgi:hypothetical protein
MREFTDQDGCNWVVYAINDAAIEAPGRRYLPDAFQQGWLVFECGERKLRLAPVPAGWSDLRNEELRTLLTQAKPTTNTTPGSMRAFGAGKSDDDATRNR